MPTDKEVTSKIPEHRDGNGRPVVLIIPITYDNPTLAASSK